MIYSAQFYFISALAVSALYWMVPRSYPYVRYAIILVFSFFVVFATYPYAALLASALTIFAWGLCRLGEIMPSDRVRGPLPFLLFLPLLTLNSVEVSQTYDPALILAITFGLSFYTLKLYGSVRLAWKTSQRSFGAFLTTAMFFPAFPAGPIDFHDRFSPELISQPYDVKLYLDGILRFGVGILKLYLISGFCNDLLISLIGQKDLTRIPWEDLGLGVVYLSCILKFLALYFNFSGYTDIAIAIARMFGLRLTENFRFPLLAHNIQNFWQRWHLSLSGFISRHIFMPLVRGTGRPVMSIFVSFVLVGLWHQVSLNYLIWGIGHGAALAFLMAKGSRSNSDPSVHSARSIALRGVSTVVTISYVAILSTFANEASFASGLRFAASLVGL